MKFCINFLVALSAAFLVGGCVQSPPPAPVGGLDDPKPPIASVPPHESARESAKKMDKLEADTKALKARMDTDRGKQEHP